MLMNPEMFIVNLNANAFEQILKYIMEGFYACNVAEELRKLGDITADSMRYIINLHKEVKHVVGLIYVDTSANMVLIASHRIN